MLFGGSKGTSLRGFCLLQRLLVEEERGGKRQNALLFVDEMNGPAACFTARGTMREIKRRPPRRRRMATDAVYKREREGEKEKQLLRGELSVGEG